MKVNEGTIDRVIRVALGVALIYIGWFTMGNSTLGIVLDVLGVVALFTGITGFCLLYKLLGNFSTTKK
jgi:hypothetical protein